MKRVAALMIALSACAQTPTATTGGARVERVVDGDTIIALVAGTRTRIRLIGVDTPETVKAGTPVQCFGPQASDFTKHALNGESVTLVYDRDRLDRYGRTLAYVYRVRDRMFVNLELLRGGFARALNIAPDDRFAREFSAAERAAKQRRLGLWGACA